jgi:hypothetical protein
MSLAAANPGGWSLNEVLTSAQMTFLQNELLKAVDGVGGGTYTLAAPLAFAGADVRIAADLEVLSTGQINVQDGAEINVLGGGLGGGRIDIESGAALHLDAGSALDIDGDADLAAAGVFTVHGEIALATSGAGELSVASGAIINVNGGRLDLNTGSDMNVEGTAHIDVEGSIEVTTGTVNIFSATGVTLQSGGRLNALGGSQIITSPGALVRIEDSNDLTINDSGEGYRLTLTPAFHDGLAPWVATTPISNLAGWVQFDVGARRTITFALPVNPGDTVFDVFARLDGDPSGAAHGGVLPTAVPTVELYSVDINGVITVHATKDDPVLGAAYDSPHNIVLQAGTETTGTMPHLATADPLYVRIRGEFGGSATPASLTLLSISGNIIARTYRADNMVY